MIWYYGHLLTRMHFCWFVDCNIQASKAMILDLLGTVVGDVDFVRGMVEYGILVGL